MHFDKLIHEIFVIPVGLFQITLQASITVLKLTNVGNECFQHVGKVGVA